MVSWILLVAFGVTCFLCGYKYDKQNAKKVVEEIFNENIDVLEGVVRKVTIDRLKWELEGSILTDIEKQQILSWLVVL